MKTKKWNNRGFTLVELIVSIGLLVVVIALTCSIILSVFNHYGKESQITEAKNIGDTVSRWLNDQLRYATELEVTDNQSVNTYDTAVQVQDGNLFYWKAAEPGAARNFYGESFYLGTTVETKAQVKNDRWLTLQVVVYDSHGELAYTKENTYEIINMGVAAKEGELDINGAIDENTIKVKVSGDLEEDEEWSNPVFCFNSDLVISRGDYFPSPQDMYNQCIYAINQLNGNDELNMEYNDDGSKWLYNQGIRNYVRINFYDGSWPDVSLYLDVNAISAPTGVSYIAPLSERNIVIQPHVTPEKGPNKKEFVVIFGRNYDSANPNGNTNWTNFVLVFVPDKYTEDGVDMSSGQWYTWLPTIAHPEYYRYDSLEGLTNKSGSIVAFFDNIKKKWHPIDGIDCTCQYFHNAAE